MPASKPGKIEVPCPHCGNRQLEPRSAFSTVCKGCGRHYRVQEALNPARAAPKATPELRHLACFDCTTALEVAISAQSAMCKRCGAYIDLRDYHIGNVVSKNFKTKGLFLVEAKGYVYNTEAVVGEAVIKGRFLGKLFAERSLTLHSTADIKGSFKTARLIIPEANHFRWKEPILVGSAEISGELAADLHVEGTALLRSTARMFGTIEAANLVVEAGAVIVGSLSIGRKRG